MSNLMVFERRKVFILKKDKTLHGKPLYYCSECKKLLMMKEYVMVGGKNTLRKYAYAVNDVLQHVRDVHDVSFKGRLKYDTN